MGQHVSTPNDTPPFAYTADDITHDHHHHHHLDSSNNAVLLEHPDFYRLEDRHLERDLSYIDTQHYAAHPPSSNDWTQVTVSQMPQGKVASSSMDLSGRSLIKIGPSIGNLRHLVKLDISYNQITTLPDEFGLLVQLRLFNASHNKLERLPDTIGQLERLKALNVSHNALTALPETMPRSLVVLIAHHNALTMVPAQLSHTRLVSLHLDNNPQLASIPVQVVEMPSIRKLVAQACGFPTVAEYPLVHGPLSLKEICARRCLLLQRQQQQGYRLPRPLVRYLASAKTCATCKGPYFDQCVTRGRMIERSGSNILVEYRLCSPHWNTEEERLLDLFTQKDDMIIEPTKVDALAAEWMRIYKQEYSSPPPPPPKSHMKKDDGDDEYYYYCRLVPSRHNSIQEQQQPSSSMTVDTMIENEQLPRLLKVTTTTTTYSDGKIPSPDVVGTSSSSSAAAAAGLTAPRYL